MRGGGCREKGERRKEKRGKKKRKKRRGVRRIKEGGALEDIFSSVNEKQIHISSKFGLFVLGQPTGQQTEIPCGSY